MFCHCALCGYRGENNGKIFFPLPLPKHKVRLFLLPTYYSTLLQSNLSSAIRKASSVCFYRRSKAKDKSSSNDRQKQSKPIRYNEASSPYLF